MKKTALKYIGVSLAVLLLSMCKKDDATKDDEQKDKDTATAYVHTWMEQITSDIGLIGMQAADNDTSSLLNTCAISTQQKADTSNTDTLTVDFGTAGCPGGDGKTRRGILQFIYNGGKHYKDSAVVIRCKPLNYSLDSNRISGTMKIVIKGRNAAGNLNWTTTDSLTLTKANSAGTVTWNASKTVEILNTSTVFTGYSNPIHWSQARVGTTGSTNGVSDDGRNYTATITSQLEKDLSCTPIASTPRRHPFLKGGINFQPAGKSLRVIDYGTGACDAMARMVLEDIPYNFGP
jgi:hypothetical protein